MPTQLDLSQGELRGAERRRVVSFAWYQVIGETEGGLARSCDLSSQGIGLVTTRVIDVGARVFVKLVHRGRAVSVVAEVMHCRPEGHFHRVGMRLEIVPPIDREAIHWMLNE